MPRLVRNSALRGYSEFVRARGGAPESLLAQCGIPLDIESRREDFFPYRALIQLLEASAEELDCPDFGMAFSERQDLEIFGPLAVIIRHSSTILEAFQQTVKFIHVFNPGQVVTLDEKSCRDEVRIRVKILLKSLPRQRQAYERSVAFGRRMLVLLGGENLRPIRVLLPHTQLAPTATYRRVFGAAVLFEQPECGIDVDAALMQRPVDQADAQIKAMALAFLESQATTDSDRLAAKVSEMVRQLLPTGKFGIEVVAEQLYLHPRTLQRRLAQTGDIFSDIVDAVRRERANRLLAETGMPMSQVTGLLGYTEQSALNRACRRWFGTTPRRQREQIRA